MRVASLEGCKAFLLQAGTRERDHAPVVEARELVGTTLCLYSWVRAYWLRAVREVHRLLIGVAYQETLVRCTWLVGARGGEVLL